MQILKKNYIRWSNLFSRCKCNLNLY